MLPKRSRAQPGPNRQESKFWTNYCSIEWSVWWLSGFRAMS